jgi:NAD(P)-dependent dehydrogenase (short-subunit alcohol dehydrogenase family)
LLDHAILDMTIAQAPIGSTFDKSSTIEDVLAGIDLGGRHAVVTGGYSGIGLATARGLSAAGAAVTLPARRPAYARRVTAEMKGIEIEPLDLADLDSIRTMAARLVGSGRSIDILINNAAVLALPETRVGPGWEAQFATNHLGHFALTNLLWPALKRSSTRARVISVSSRGHRLQGGGIRWHDLQFERGYDKRAAYRQAKTANCLFAVELDRLAKDAGVRAFAVHPGGARTRLHRHMTHEEMVRAGWIDNAGNALVPFKTHEQGAATSAWAATSPQLDGIGGVYCEDCDIARVSDANAEDGAGDGVAPYAIDPEEATKLWAVSAELTGVDAFVNRHG